MLMGHYVVLGKTFHFEKKDLHWRDLADNATFLASNSVLGTLFSSEHSSFIQL